MQLSPLRFLKNGLFLLAAGVCIAVAAWWTGSVVLVWAAIVFIAAGLMRLRIGSPVYLVARGDASIGGEGNAGD